MLYGLLPILYIPRFIDGLMEQYRTANVTFRRESMDDFCLSLLNHSGHIDHRNPSFRFTRIISQSQLKNLIVVATRPLQNLLP